MTECNDTLKVPQWVAESFARSIAAAGSQADREEVDAVCGAMLETWRGPGRHFHDTSHLFDLLARIDSLATEAQNPDLVRLAAWGHGLVFSTSQYAVYTRNGGEDREKSALAARDIYLKLRVPAANVEIIADLITRMRSINATMIDTGVFEPEDMDLLVLVDAHLGFLANQPQKYRKYVAAIRAEYAHISDAEFIEARYTVVSKLLARKRLFTTPLAKQWEESARQNLISEQKRLAALWEAGGFFPTEDTSEIHRIDPDYVPPQFRGDGTTTQPAALPTPAQSAPGEAALPAGAETGPVVGAGAPGAGASRADAGTDVSGAGGIGAGMTGAGAAKAAAVGSAGAAALGLTTDEDMPEPGITTISAPAPVTSSLEEVGAEFDPGEHITPRTPEEARAAQRAEIARKARERIEREGSDDSDLPGGLVE